MLQFKEVERQLLGAGVSDLPEVACGYWWEDKWCTPYLRGRFNVTGDAPHLYIKARNPEIRNRTSFLRVRIGTRSIAEFTDIAAGAWIDEAISLAPFVNDNDVLDVSLRFDASWRPSNGDVRELAALLFDWRVAPAQAIA